MAGKGTGKNILGQLERSWFAVRVACNSGTPLNQLKRTYWEKQLGSTYSSHGMSELEDNWLRKVITTAGQTPTVDARPSTLWKEAVAALGLTTSKYLNDNKITFYGNVAS
jgi:hypothetical protein